MQQYRVESYGATINATEYTFAKNFEAALLKVLAKPHCYLPTYGGFLVTRCEKMPAEESCQSFHKRPFDARYYAKNHLSQERIISVIETQSGYFCPCKVGQEVSGRAVYKGAHL